MLSASSYGHLTAAKEFWSQCHIFRFGNNRRSSRRGLFQIRRPPGSTAQCTLGLRVKGSEYKTVHFVPLRSTALPVTRHCGEPTFDVTNILFSNTFVFKMFLRCFKRLKNKTNPWRSVVCYYIGGSYKFARCSTFRLGAWRAHGVRSDCKNKY